MGEKSERVKLVKTVTIVEMVLPHNLKLLLRTKNKAEIVYPKFFSTID